MNAKRQPISDLLERVMRVQSESVDLLARNERLLDLRTSLLDEKRELIRAIAEDGREFCDRIPPLT